MWFQKLKKKRKLHFAFTNEFIATNIRMKQIQFTGSVFWFNWLHCLIHILVLLLLLLLLLSPFIPFHSYECAVMSVSSINSVCERVFACVHACMSLHMCFNILWMRIFHQNNTSIDILTLTFTSHVLLESEEGNLFTRIIHNLHAKHIVRTHGNVSNFAKKNKWHRKTIS